MPVAGRTVAVELRPNLASLLHERHLVSDSSGGEHTVVDLEPVYTFLGAVQTDNPKDFARLTLYYVDSQPIIEGSISVDGRFYIIEPLAVHFANSFEDGIAIAQLRDGLVISEVAEHHHGDDQ